MRPAHGERLPDARRSDLPAPPSGRSGGGRRDKALVILSWIGAAAVAAVAWVLILFVVLEGLAK
jgi:hypothetical protein